MACIRCAVPHTARDEFFDVLFAVVNPASNKDKGGAVTGNAFALRGFRRTPSNIAAVLFCRVEFLHDALRLLVSDGWNRDTARPRKTLERLI